MEKTLTELYNEGDCKYLVLNLAAKRIKQLLHGEKPAIATELVDDAGSVAMKEIMNGKLKMVSKKKAGKVVDLAKQDS